MEEEKGILKEIIKNFIIEENPNYSDEDGKVYDDYIEEYLSTDGTFEEESYKMELLSKLYIRTLFRENHGIFNYIVSAFYHFHSEEEPVYIESCCIYKTLQWLGLENAQIILSKMGNQLTFDILSDCLRRKSEDGFIDEFRKHDTSNIINFISYIYYIIRMPSYIFIDEDIDTIIDKLDRSIIGFKQKAEQVNDVILSNITEFELTRNKIEAETSPENGKTRKALLSYIYCTQYLDFQDLDSVLTRRDKKIIRFILDRPVFKELQKHCIDFHNGIISYKEFLKPFDIIPGIQKHFASKYQLELKIGESNDSQAQLSNEKRIEVDDETKDKLLTSSKELLGFIELDAFQKEFVFNFFENVFGNHINDESGIAPDALINAMLSNSSKYKYKEMNLMIFCQIVGFLAAKKVIRSGPTEIAKKLDSGLRKWEKPQRKESHDPNRTTNLKSYIQRAKGYFEGKKGTKITGEGYLKLVFNEMDSGKAH